MKNQKGSRVDLLEKKVQALTMYVQDMARLVAQLRTLATGNRLTMEKFSEYEKVTAEILKEIEADEAKETKPEIITDAAVDLKHED